MKVKPSLLFEFFNFFYLIAIVSVGVVVPFYLFDMGLDLSFVGLLLSIFYLATPFLRILLALFVDRGLGKILLTASALVGALSSFLYTFPNHIAIAAAQITRALSFSTFITSQRPVSLEIGGKALLLTVVSIMFLAYGLAHFLAAIALYSSSYFYIFLFGGLLLLAGTILMWITPIRHHKLAKFSTKWVFKHPLSFYISAMANALTRSWIMVISGLVLPYIFREQPLYGIFFIGIFFLSMGIGTLVGKIIRLLYPFSLLLALINIYVFNETQELHLLLPFAFFLGVIIEKEEIRVVKKHLHKSTPATDLAIYWLFPYLLSFILYLTIPFVLNTSPILTFHILDTLITIPILFYMVR